MERWTTKRGDEMYKVFVAGDHGLSCRVLVNYLNNNTMELMDYYIECSQDVLQQWS